MLIFHLWYSVQFISLFLLHFVVHCNSELSLHLTIQAYLQVSCPSILLSLAIPCSVDIGDCYHNCHWKLYRVYLLFDWIEVCTLDMKDTVSMDVYKGYCIQWGPCIPLATGFWWNRWPYYMRNENGTMLYFGENRLTCIHGRSFAS